MTEKRVVWTNPDGSVSVLTPILGVYEKVWRKDIPMGVNPIETDTDHMPKDRLFRAAWKASADGCTECPVKAKEVAHALRRAKRAEEFAPHDEAIAKRLPGAEETAEAARQQIRDKYAQVQLQIDACQTTNELRAALKTCGVA